MCSKMIPVIWKQETISTDSLLKILKNKNKMLTVADRGKLYQGFKKHENENYKLVSK